MTSVPAAETAAAEWELWSTTARLVVTDPAALAAARRLVDAYLDRVDHACNRFRADSEISTLTPGRPATISALFDDYLDAALTVARDTDGDVDPTLGADLENLGYDRDFTQITAGPTVVALRITPRPDWSQVIRSPRAVTLPAGVRLDFGATAKALAADRCARTVADALGCGVLVSLGGDIATAGPAPGGHWQVLVQDGATQPAALVRLPAGAAIATSSTVRRRWIRGGRPLHHILDPRTGCAAEPVWRTVSVAAESCLAANAAATAAVVRGRAALPWLRSAGLPARLVGRDGRVLTLGGWPDEPEGIR
ncbi:FAD:protein FMN transferase [Nocardia cerradoensis]|uniref:FAD:protein FMN transferase n=1 Tax=Nocardia cerradoensis TaxID=85688 RepID=A0A231GTX9_9NOCA|nr:FAD:protein FMN transferase [Nocardia cerradoensis]OXR40077.1 FAD:protein FMN transferase [Nocardia cerradoensis]